MSVFLSEHTIQAIGWMLLHFVWQGIAVAAVLAIANMFLRNPRWRYATACAALLVMVVLPLVTFWVHQSERPSGPTLLGPRNESPFVMAATPSAAATLTESAQRHDGPTSVYQSWPASLAVNLQDHIPQIVLWWSVGVLLLSLRLLGGCWASYPLRRIGTQPLPEVWCVRVRNLAKRQGLRRGVEVVTSSMAKIPMVVGIFRPVVLIPTSSLLGLTPDQLEAILVHELAHIRRYDNLVNLLQRLVETTFFFHPAVWWVSRGIRTEREHCCDDAAAGVSDPKSYAFALATLEELRGPALAVAATDGSLLSRVKRLLAADVADGRDRLVSPPLVSLASVLGFFVLAVVVGGTETNITDAGPKGDEPMNIMVDVKPSNRGDTLPLCLSPLMQAVGRPEWSRARLEGFMGHAFHFEMIEGGGGVMHDNIDWGLALDFVPQLAEFHEFHANKHDTDVNLPELKREARDSVRVGLEQGFPALVWQPMSLEQKASDHPAHHAFCWGLIVGYNEAEETYTVRHPYVADTYTVRYDAIGHADPVEWFNVRVYVQPTAADEKEMHRTALRNAIGFAMGIRYTDEQFMKHNGVPSIPYGFAAYELWREAFESEDVPLEISRHHAETLKGRRLVAAEYMRELVALFPKAADPLESAAMHYDRELESLNPLYDLCVTAKSRKGWKAEDRAEVQGLIEEALKADREAIISIEAALALIDASQ